MKTDSQSIGPLTTLTRRRFVVSAGFAAAAVWCAWPRVVAADDGIVGTIKTAASNDKITLTKLRGNVSVMMGSGGNIAVLTGPDGTLLIDAGITASQPKILAALAGIDAAPVRHLVNTHWHFDHTDGNAWLHDAGATITAHENTRKRMSVRHRVPGWRFTFPPAPRGALPTTTFKQKLTLDLNNTVIQLDAYEAAHTDSDISARFVNDDVIHVGDTWWNGFYPFIDYSSGGSIDGTIAAAEANISAVSDKTIVIPGHGPVGTKSELIEFRDMLVAIRERVAALKESGKSLEQTQAAKPTADFDEKWGKFVTTPNAFVELVYQGV